MRTLYGTTMDTLAVVARSILAAVFAVSGIAKLLDRAGTREAVKGFGVPGAAVGAIAAALPVAECAAAAALLPGTTARAGAFGALGLLVAFMAGISVNLAQGRRPDCHCFGQIHSAPVGPSTLVRNVVLAAGAGIVAFGAGPDAGGSIADAIGDLNAAGAVIAVAAVAAAVSALVLLARRKSGLLTGAPADASAQRPAGPPVGSAAPEFSLPTTRGGTVALADLLGRRKELLLVFFSPSCGPCIRIAPELARWQEEFADRITVAVLSTGSPETVDKNATTQEISEVLVDEHGSVAKLYSTRGTPGAVRIDAGGVVVSEYAAGEAAIGDLLLEVFGVTELVAAAAEEKDAEETLEDGETHDHPPEPVAADLTAPDAIDERFVPVARTDVTIGERDGETVLVDRSSGAVHLLNPTAAIVWQCLDGSGTIDEIAIDIADVFGQDASEVGETVVDVVRRFGRQGLLVGVGTPAEPATESGATGS